MKEPMLVTKYSGEVEPFDENRLRKSLEHAGASKLDINKILHHVRAEMFDKKTTAKIYHEAFLMLKKLSKASAARYNLKRSLMELGPSGFPFEKFVAALFAHQGYEVENNLMLKGKCVSHELDVMAKRNQSVLFIECKFHNRQGLKSDVKVAMYYKSRFEDLKAGNSVKSKYKDKKLEGYLVTNTRFTEDAIQYSKCENLHLMGWDFPQNASLKDKIELVGLYPITCLTTIKKSEKMDLIKEGLVMVKDLAKQPEALHRFRMSEIRFNRIMGEVDDLCNG
jgi:hypothetical protein